MPNNRTVSNNRRARDICQKIISAQDIVNAHDMNKANEMNKFIKT